MKPILTLLSFLLIISCQAQNTQKFNLDFENHTAGKELSDGWIKWGNYDLSIDTESHSGKKSGKITSDETGSSFGSIAYKIPANYRGKSIRLEGFMKIKDVEDGFAGLLLRINGNGGTLAFDNMENQEITGTKDWQKYSITLDYTDEVENIFIAGILSGKGEVWFDDFTVTIDGENVQTLKIPKFAKSSLIEINDLTPNLIDNLELLGRTWGFLKYHHPVVAKGNYNWDYELFEFFPQYIKETEESKRNKLIVDWIDKLGNVEKCTECKPTDEAAFLKPDLKWIENQKDILKEKLMFIYQNRHQGEQHYIEITGRVKNPQFINEKAYTAMKYPDDGFRLLSLYRYWNMINYFFPYKHLIDKEWNTTLKEYIPIFLNAKDELEYETAALKIIGDIQDTHANLWRGGDKIKEWKGGYYAPVRVGFVENQLVVTDFYNPELKEETELEIGDIITEIDGKSIEDLLKEKTAYYPASNQAARLRDMAMDLLRSKATEINIKYIKADATQHSKKLQLYTRNSLNIYGWYRKDDDKCYKMLDDNIGYVTLQSIKKEDVPEIKKAFKDTKGIVIDIRNYPSAFVPFTLGSYFVSAPAPFVKFTKGSINNPGEFKFTKVLKVPNREEVYQGKLIVLLNEISQSQAEYTAMAFRAGDNTTIVGSTTAGADGNVSNIFLPGGLLTKISGIGVYYPNGEETQKIGIVPDVKIEPTIEGVRKGRDELLEKAVELILEE